MEAIISTKVADHIARFCSIIAHIYLIDLFPLCSPLLPKLKTHPLMSSWFTVENPAQSWNLFFDSNWEPTFQVYVW